MILVLCGTQKQAFLRLWEQLQPLIPLYDLRIQAGHNPWPSNPPHLQIVDFIQPSQMIQWIEEADLIITHAGAGSMLQAIQAKKRVIAVPRLAQYQEHVNDHQLELACKFEALGYLKVLHDQDDLLTLVESMYNFQPAAYQPKKDLIPTLRERLADLLSP